MHPSQAPVADSLLRLDNPVGFQTLGPAFFTQLPPTPLPAPHWVATSGSVAQLLGMPADWSTNHNYLHAFTGNSVLPSSTPIASVYSGHQFGVWAGQLGDGRALLLGETPQGLEVQLKGAGRTPYSRMGDGRAVLRSSIREFLCSEAMHALGIPSTRALCITGSPAPVYREQAETAAVVTRVAPSFLRFGHFEHFAAREMVDALRTLTHYAIKRYYPDCANAGDSDAAQTTALLKAVSENTGRLLAHWQAVGFCHGVMNTDNMSLLGLTIDYGPFQFLDAFDPNHICNHSDHQGRYAFAQQPQMAYWNLYCLAQALMPLIDDEDQATEAVAHYKTAFTQHFLQLMQAKLGLHLAASPTLQALVEGIIALLAESRVDYTIFWRRLSHAVGNNQWDAVRDLFHQRENFDAWNTSYQQALGTQDRAQTSRQMLANNPKFVLRNHLGEEAIRSAQQGDFSAVHTLLKLLEAPFDEHPGHEAYAAFPPDWASSIHISCSS